MSNNNKDTVLDTVPDTDNSKEIAISWVILALRDIMGREHIRNNIITTFVPDIPNAKHMKTFDAFQQYKKAPFDNKQKKILKYCEKIMKLKNKVVFTASNIQQNAKDMETHYQSFLLDNTAKKLFVIDPAKTKTGYGIYAPMVTYETIQPFFEANGYTVQYIELSNPAQTNTEDVFCQSWSLYILLDVLESYASAPGSNGIHSVKIPKSKLKKYGVLLDFYKKVLLDDNIANELNETYFEYITNKTNKKNIVSNGGDIEKMMHMNAVDIILNMSPNDMQE